MWRKTLVTWCHVLKDQKDADVVARDSEGHAGHVDSEEQSKDVESRWTGSEKDVTVSEKVLEPESENVIVLEREPAEVLEDVEDVPARRQRPERRDAGNVDSQDSEVVILDSMEVALAAREAVMDSEVDTMDSEVHVDLEDSEDTTAGQDARDVVMVSEVDTMDSADSKDSKDTTVAQDAKVVVMDSEVITDSDARKDSKDHATPSAGHVDLEKVIRVLVALKDSRVIVASSNHMDSVDTMGSEVTMDLDLVGHVDLVDSADSEDVLNHAK